ncbi:MAG: hypothetical protein IKL84_03995, partial [Clostridia bacterium]|nr:hypothetical protein [Clostridia bacterium]
PEEIEELRFAGRGRHLPLPGECICAPGDFTVNRVTGDAEIETGDSFVSLLCTAGEGKLLCGGEEYPLSAGCSYFLPAGLPICRIEGNATLLCSRA